MKIHSSFVKADYAFTLIELMVAVAIIALLTAIIMTNFSSSKARARDSQRISDLAQIQLALSLFYDRCNQFPTSITNPPTNDTATACPTGITLGSYIGKIPIPPSGSATTYDYSINNTTPPPTDYVLHTTLESPNPSATANGLSSAPSYTVGTGVTISSCGTALDYCVGPK